jgi:hypothetical protein
MEELRAKVDKIAATVLPAFHLDLQRIIDEQQPMSMDVLPTLHSDLQRIVNEQQPMSMDVLPTLHPDLQRVVDKKMASSMPQLQPQDMLELLPPPPPILLEQDLIYKIEAVLLEPPPPSPPVVAAAPTAPPPEQPPSVPSPPAVARVNMFAHTVEAGDDEAVDLDHWMSVLISSIIGHSLEGGPSLHGTGRFRPFCSPARRPRHCNLGPRSAAAPAHCVWRRPCRSQPPR